MVATAGELLHRITALLERSGDALLRGAFGVSYSRALLLRAISAQPGISQRELAHALGYTAPAVSSLLKEIHGAGLVTVSESAASKRVHQVSLTEKGAELEAEISETLSTRFGDVLHAASVNESDLIEILARIEAVLSGAKESDNG